MKIKDIYRKKGNFLVSLCLAAACVIVTAISAINPETYNGLAYAFPLQNPRQLLTGLFLHGSPALSPAATMGHLAFNLLLVLPFGILVEKIMGSRRFLLVTAVFWIVYIFTFYTVAFATAEAGETIYGAGISGIAFSYGTIGIYILAKLFRSDRKTLLRQFSFYLLLNIALIMLVMVNPMVAGVQSMIIHLAAIASAALFLLFCHKSVDRFLSPLP